MTTYDQSGLAARHLDEIREGYGALTGEQRRHLVNVLERGELPVGLQQALLRALRPMEWVDLRRIHETPIPTDVPRLVLGIRLRRSLLPQWVSGLSVFAPASLLMRVIRTTDVASLLAAREGANLSEHTVPDTYLPSLGRHRHVTNFSQLLGEGIRFAEPVLLLPCQELVVESKGHLDAASEPWKAQMLVVGGEDVVESLGIHALTPRETIKLRDFAVPAESNETWEIIEREALRVLLRDGEPSPGIRPSRGSESKKGEY
jgi:hypothetical protein